MAAPEPSGSSPSSSGKTQPAQRLAQWLAGLSDTRLTLLVAALLFALAGWPLLLVDLPPFQDLPNHVATAHIIAHPELYPEYAFNGFLKSNSLLTLWFALVGSHGLCGAARAFVAIVLATTALALPLFVLRFAGRHCLPIAMLFVWPLVHGFFVSMGMLNFALAFALSLLLLTVLDRQRERPTWLRGLGIAVMAGLVWYAHPFPLAVVALLVALHAITRSTWRERGAAGFALLLPLVPAGLLSLLAAQQHLVKTERGAARAAAALSYLNPWETVGHLWLNASGALTRWGSVTLVPLLLLPYFAWRQRRSQRPFFSLPAMAVLAAAYVGLPETLSNWSYLNCRLVPFLWAGLALRAPSSLPRSAAVLLAACALSFSAVLGVDYVRLDRDRALFTAGLDVVPARATLLPLLFEKRRTGDFVASLTHAWGYYTAAKDTSAPLVFAVERSYPITYREFPPPALIPPALDRFAELHGTPARTCKLLRRPAADAACTALWRGLWNDFWQQAEPRFGHLLAWAMPPEARATIPPTYHRVLAAGELEIYARKAPATGALPTHIEEAP
ncbi:MAG: hypothetical protein JXP73_18485 [Deltaproteobacteria bacterium]|nr:hypothetical protein [Deltaproteobacteria bacterium]